MSVKDYPEHYGRLKGLMAKLGKECPATMQAFSQLHSEALSQGALSPKVKELISLGIAITCRCDGCISFHVPDALKAGATKEEIAETIGVAILMGGGPSVMYGCEAFEALGQFDATASQAAA